MAGDDSADFLPRKLESDLIDLTVCSLREIWSLDIRFVAVSLDRLLRQVNRPRGNFAGGGGEPDRID